MLIQCQNCSGKYRITIKKVPGKTVSFKCAKCGAAIKIRPEDIEAGQAGADGGAKPRPETVKFGCIKCGNTFIKQASDPNQICNQCRIDSLVNDIKHKYGAPAAPQAPAPSAPPPPAEPRYTIRSADGLVLGPIKLKTVTVLVRERRVRGLEEVSKDGSEYLPLMKYPELAEFFPDLKEIMDTSGLEDKVEEAFMAVFSSEDETSGFMAPGEDPGPAEAEAPGEDEPEPPPPEEAEVPEPTGPPPEPEDTGPAREEPVQLEEQPTSDAAADLPEALLPDRDEPALSPTEEAIEIPLETPSPADDDIEVPLEEPAEEEPAPSLEDAEPEPSVVEMEGSFDLNDRPGDDDDAIMSMDDFKGIREQAPPAEPAESEPAESELEEPATAGPDWVAEEPVREEPHDDEIVDLDAPLDPTSPEADHTEPGPEPEPEPEAERVGTEFDVGEEWSDEPGENAEPGEDAEPEGPEEEPEEIIEDLEPVKEPPPDARYRLRYPDGLILGPIKLGTIQELFATGNLTGQEEVQREDEDWAGFTDLPELVDLIALAEAGPAEEVMEEDLIDLTEMVEE